MNLLLDTHTFIWFFNGEELLSLKLKDLITDTSNKCFIRIASIWEIAIKSSINKLKLKGRFDQIAGFIYENDVEVVPITFKHIQRLLYLDFHHRDPFDRIVISQALCEDFVIAT